MSTTFNIYKINPAKIGEFLEKLKSIGLQKQKTKKISDYNLTFYFSENVKGNEIWWLKTYKDFFNSSTVNKTNLFHYGLLLCEKTDTQKTCFVVSLGKSHFYLNKYIQTNFGIDLAVRMANEKTTLLKKSRFFAGAKRQEVSSYQDFIIDSYAAGESVEHIKLKAENIKLWGGKNIIFADSIQLEINKNPDDLPELFLEIEKTLNSKEIIINLPKIESASPEISIDLDKILLENLKNTDLNSIAIEELVSNGVNISFRTNDNTYSLRYLKQDKKYIKSNFLDTIDSKELRQFILDNQEITDINNLKIQFRNEDKGSFSQPIKEVIDTIIPLNQENYFLKNGEWYKFNQVFREYLKRSLENIKIIKQLDLNEDDYIAWRNEKIKKIDSGDKTIDKVIYREYYFNEVLSSNHGYDLLDRELTAIKSLSNEKLDYRLEIADLYKDGEIVSLKISDDKISLIYNIEQSKIALEAILRKLINFEKKLQSVGLWFVFERKVDSIIDFNSIQFLLALESWKKLVESYGLIPRIHISTLINKS